MIHLALPIASALTHALWHPLSGTGASLYGGVLGDLGELTLVAGALALLKHLNCDAPGCWRYGPHRTADRHHKLCRVHHTDLPNHKLSLEEIVERHHKHKSMLHSEHEQIPPNS
jgi:hypothetical protein